VYLHLGINRVNQIDVAVIAKIHDIKELLARGRVEPDSVFSELKRLAASDQWQTREVAATALVEIGKRHPAAVLDTARRWARDHDANVRRAASEGLRGIVKVDPQAVRPILEMLHTDPELYVKKSVANVLRNAGGKHPELVLSICRHWSRSNNPHTGWIVKEGLRKLKGSRARDVAAILETLNNS
jgi:3-methyladenine DNA glycosylase AlkC